MTRPRKQRLDRVEDALYPSETMALWLGQAKTEHRSLHALIQSYKDEPDNTWPLTVLSGQVESGPDPPKGAGGRHRWLQTRTSGPYRAWRVRCRSQYRDPLL